MASCCFCTAQANVNIISKTISTTETHSNGKCDALFQKHNKMQDNSHNTGYSIKTLTNITAIKEAGENVWTKDKITGSKQV